MRDYKQVVNERYENDGYDGNSVMNNAYSVINPIGFYGAVNNTELLREYVHLLLQETDKPLEKVRILDVGCGNGVNTRLLAEMFCSPQNVFGVEYSPNRLNHCRKMNPAIECCFGDIVEGLAYDKQYFDGVIIFDVLMHVRKDEDIKRALENCNSVMCAGGVLLWYEPNVKSHFDNLDKDGWGFSQIEMDQYAEKTGFKLIRKKRLYRWVPIFNSSTYYLTQNHSMLLMSILNKLLPTKHTINVRMYKKK